MKLYAMKTKRERFILAPAIKDAPIRIHPSMRSFTGYCLYKVALRLRGRMDHELESFGLVAPQCGMMALLKTIGPMTQIELGSHLSIDKATMVRFLDILENKKFLIRVTDPKDRRAKVLQVTKAGEKILEAALKIKARVEEEVFAPLTKSERETFRALIAKVAIDEAPEK